MFERYTQAARNTIFWARYMASQLGSPEIETEHLLLGLLRADMSLARRVLGSPWAAESVWKKIEQIKPIREQIPVTREIPLNNVSKHVLVTASEEADLLSNTRICTEHLLLGLLREKECFAAKLLAGLDVHFAPIRAELLRVPHDDSKREDFVRERGPLPQDIVELQTRVRSIRVRLEDAIANHDFEKARTCSDEERVEREKLLLLYHQH
jgi:ATP-dependent Clp protease ATP-binding subunit ClpC